jgi:cell division protein FtsQ
VRSRRRRRWASASGLVVVLAGIAWVVFFSTWLSVQRIVVRGTDRVPVTSVRLATDAELDRAMVLVDPRSVSALVARVPLVREVDVVRQWPSTLVVTVHERVPAAAVPVPGGVGFRLVDRDGVEVEVSATKPVDLPFLEVDVARAGALALQSALDVIAGLPGGLLAKVTGVGADSPDGVWLRLDNSAKVVWGGTNDGPRKAVVLQDLLTASDGAKGGVYDVSAPDTPAVTKRR